MNKNHPHSPRLLYPGLAVAALALTVTMGDNGQPESVSETKISATSPAAKSLEGAGGVVISFNHSARGEGAPHKKDKPALAQQDSNCVETERVTEDIKRQAPYDLDSLALYARNLSTLYRLSTTLEKCSSTIQTDAAAAFNREDSQKKVMAIAHSYGSHWISTLHQSDASPEQKGAAAQDIQRLLTIAKFIGQLTADDDLEGGEKLVRDVSTILDRDKPAPGR